MLRGGIIGLGNVAVHGHVPGWLSRPDVEIVAVTDTEPARRAAAARLPASRWHDTAEELMDDGTLDFVDVCTPPSSHAGLIRAALGRGLHVLCEKPLVGSMEDLRALGGLADGARRVLHTVHNWHHAPIVAKTRELVASGAIGVVTAASWQTLRTRPAAVADGGAANWRVDPKIAGGGVLTDHGWHVCYILRGWMGAAPTAVSARLETRRHVGWPVEDTATLRLRFPGSVAEVVLTWAADERRNHAQLTGTAGSIEILDDTLVVRGAAPQRLGFASGLSDGSQHPDWFHAVAERFVAAVTGGGDGNLAEAAMCVAVEAAARESHDKGGLELPLATAIPSCSERSS